VTPEPTPEQYRDVLAFVRRRVASPGEAEEITQEVYASLAQALERSAESAPRTLGWLYTVARRRIADESRKRAPTATPLELVPGAAPDYGVFVARSLQGALARLTPAQREVVVLRLLRGVSFGEIARRLEITEDAARMRFLRGLEQLRAELEQEGVGP
jgi:RNA polymerase sigma-70 factor, ECF subfamily